MSSDLRKAIVQTSKSANGLSTWQTPALLYERMPAGLPFQMSPQTAGKVSSSLQTWWVVSLGQSKDTCILTLASLLCPLSHSGNKGKLLRETVYSFLILKPLWGTCYFCDEEEKDWKARWLLQLMLSPLPVALYKLKLKGGRKTKPEAEPQKPWMPSPLAGGDAPVPVCLTVASGGSCPSHASLWLEGARASQASVAPVGPPSSGKIGPAP